MEYQLSVDGYDLREGLKRFETRRKIRSTKKKALLGFDGRFFSIEALDRVVVCKAEGVWPGLATVNANVVAALAFAPPTGDMVPVSCTGARLRLGSLTVACGWQPVSHTLLDLSAAPDWIETLSLKYRAPRAKIASGKYASLIKSAERKLDRLIAKAAKPLTPFGITAQDLRDLIEDRLARRYATNS